MQYENYEKTIEEKFLGLKKQLEYKQYKLYYIQDELKSRNVAQKDLEKSIEHFNKLRVDLQTKLAEIQASIPDFDIETCNKYKTYWEQKSQIDKCKINIDSLIEHINIKESEKEERYLEKQKLEAEIANIEKELRNLKSEEK